MAQGSNGGITVARDPGQFDTGRILGIKLLQCIEASLRADGKVSVMVSGVIAQVQIHGEKRRRVMSVRIDGFSVERDSDDGHECTGDDCQRDNLQIGRKSLHVVISGHPIEHIS